MGTPKWDLKWDGLASCSHDFTAMVDSPGPSHHVESRPDDREAQGDPAHRNNDQIQDIALQAAIQV